MTQRAQVKNAADPEQVKRARRKEKDAVDRRRAVMAAVLDTPDGRELMWSLLGDTGVFESPFNPSGSTVYYNIGRSDYGRQLLAELASEHREAYLLMEREARDQEARDERERDAVHTASAVGDTDG